MSEWTHLRLERDGDDRAWLTLDQADSRVNVLSSAVLAELRGALESLEAQPPAALVIRSAKAAGFVAGADIEELATLHGSAEAREFVQRGHHVMNRLAAARWPTLALIHGHCLGGGLELALACRYRIAVDDPATRLGLPEVRLGIHPGFGGTVRGIGVLGPLAGLDVILSGRSLDARRARQLGLVDRAVPLRQLDAAAHHLLAEAPAPRTAGWQARLLSSAPLRPLVAAQARRRLASRVRREHYPAPFEVIDLWAAEGGSPRRMLEAEAESVARLAEAPTARNLMRVFFLQERLKRQGRAGDFAGRHVHVIGAGAMGGDIAAWCAAEGLDVSLEDLRAEAVAKAIGRAQPLLERRLRDRGRVRAAQDRLMPDPRGHGRRRADLVIEAVVEDADIKRALYRELEPQLRAETPIASNTSSLPLEDLAQGLAQPQRLIGLHFFNPVARMELVEVVRGAQSGGQALARGAGLVRRISRLPLPVASRPGFLVNRVLAPYLLEALLLLDEGVAAETIDAAAREFGMPMGPVELADQVGLDICLAVARQLAPLLQRDIPPRLEQRVDSGRLGVKSGEGFYRYRDGKPLRREGGDGVRPADLQDRLILSQVNEALACVDEGVVEDLDLADAGIIFGTGFAPFRGGPLHYARQAGPAELRQRLARLHERHGERFAERGGWERLQAAGS